MCILPIDGDSNESVIASDCSYTDECQLTGDEFVGRYTCFGSTAAEGQLQPIWNVYLRATKLDQGSSALGRRQLLYLSGLERVEQRS
jgi:hypothetical protein